MREFPHLQAWRTFREKKMVESLEEKEIRVKIYEKLFKNRERIKKKMEGKFQG